MRIKLYFVTLVLIAMAAVTVGAQTNTFTYQGRLTDNTVAAGGTYEMQFRVFDASTGGLQQPQPSPITLIFTVAGSNPVPVVNGAFTVQLNFGAGVFTGADRWLEISVRKPSDPPGYTLLTPRQPITSSPYAIKTINAGAADSVTAACNLCITNAQISGIDGSKVTGSVANATNAGSATTAATATNALNLGGLAANTYLQTNGNGSQLTNLNGANITNNTVSSAALAADTFPNNQNLSRLGQLRWDLLAQRFATANSPFGVAFDGANIWVSNQFNNNVNKLRASDGNLLGTFAIGASGNRPQGIAFDGTNIWIANALSNNVTKMLASTGAVLGTFAAGTFPMAVAFDGANVWVVNFNSNNVTKLLASTGAVQGTFVVGTNPQGVAFDGFNIWVANSGSNNVTKLRASDGALVGTYAAGTQPSAIAFDGSNIWVASGGSTLVTKLRSSDGSSQGTFTVGSQCYGIAFDGVNVWVTSYNNNNVTKLRASDGALQGVFATGNQPYGIAFDGSNMWIANQNINTVMKLPVFP